MSEEVARLNAKVNRALAEMEHYTRLAKETIKTEVHATPSAIKAAAVPAAVGAAVMWLANSEMIANSDIVKKNWWLLPVAILGVAYLLSRSKDMRKRAQAPALLAIGGALLVVAYKNRPDAKAASATPNTTTKASDTGAIEPARLAYQLHPMDNSFAWLQGPSGQLVRVELAPMLRQFGPMLQTTAVTGPANDAAARLAAAAFA